MCDCGDSPKVFNEMFRKARKVHRCCECGRTIERGENYQYVSGIWDFPASFKTCLRCAELRDEANDSPNADYLGCGPCFTELGEWWAEEGVRIRTADA